MQPEGMQKGRETLHDEKDGYREDGEDGKNDEDPDEPSPASKAKADAHHHGPEHLRQLCGSKRETLSHQVSAQYTSPHHLRAEVPLRSCGSLSATALVMLVGLPTRGSSGKVSQRELSAAKGTNLKSMR